MATTYIVDHADRIVEVSPDWDSFAAENGGEAACASRVVGQLLFDNIDGDPVRMFMHAILMRVRASGLPEEVPYRCDSPRARRYYRMTVAPLGAGGLRVEHVLDREEPMERTVRVRTAFSARRCIPRCSLCCRLKEPEGWRDPFEFATDSDVRVIHTVCPDCRDAAIHRASPAKPLGFHLTKT